MEINEPNDLLHFFYKYGLKELPVSSDGEISGKLQKSAVVKFLSRSEQFESNVVTTMERLVETADKQFLDTLTRELEEGEIKGIPILRMTGEVDRVITPGFLEARDQAQQFLSESEKRQLYEEFLDYFPFPVTLSRNDQLIFSNDAFETLEEPENWKKRTFQHDAWECALFLPRVVDDLFRDYGALQAGEAIDLRERMESIEEDLLKLAEDRASSISEAAKKVGLPRQTFHYRRKKQDESDE